MEFLLTVFLTNIKVSIKRMFKYHSPHVRELIQWNPRGSWILDTTPWIPDSRHLIPIFFLVELGFWIPILSRIPNSLSCIPESKVQDSEFHKQNFPPFRIPKGSYYSQTPLKRTMRMRGLKSCHIHGVSVLSGLYFGKK